MRPATETEKFIFEELVCKQNKMSRDELADHYTFVLDNYSTDTPGYQGPVGLIIWCGGPAWVTIFTRNHETSMWEIALDTCYLTELVIPRMEEKLKKIKEVLEGDYVPEANVTTTQVIFPPLEKAKEE